MPAPAETEGHRALPRLYLISDAARLGEGRFLAAVEQAVAGGLRWILVREPSWEAGRVEALLEALAPRVPPGTMVTLGWRPGPEASRREQLVAGRGLAGLHLGACEPQEAAAVRARRPHWLLGYSAHGSSDAAAALASGADYTSCSPVFAPHSKRGDLPPLGLEELERAAAQARGPVYALGGIDAARARRAREAGAYGVAAVGAILDAPRPEEAAREIIEALGEE